MMLDRFSHDLQQVLQDGSLTIFNGCPGASMRSGMSESVVSESVVSESLAVR